MKFRRFPNGYLHTSGDDVNGIECFMGSMLVYCFSQDFQYFGPLVFTRFFNLKCISGGLTTLKDELETSLICINLAALKFETP